MAKTRANTLPAPAPAPRHARVEHKRVNIEVPAAHITTTHNPRWPLPNLQKLGYVPIELCKNWVTSGTPEQRAEYCTLIEGNEPSIVALAESFKHGEEQRGYGQLQAIILRPFRVKVGTEVEEDSEETRNVYETRYGLIAGERRLAANRYLFAKYGIDLPLMAIAIECTKEDAFDMAIEENANRQDPNELEWGAMYLWYHKNKPRLDAEGKPVVNPTTGETVLGWKVDAIAAKFKRQTGHIRGRMACATPGKLSPEQIQGYLDGKIKITRLVEIATGQKPYRNPLEPHHRRGVRTLAETRKMFDTLNSKDEQDSIDTAHMEMLAWFMLYPTNDQGDLSVLGMKQARLDSEKRITAAATEEVKPVRKQAAKKRAKV